MTTRSNRTSLLAAVVGLTALLAGDSATAAPSSADEYEIKAALLLNFARFAQWPEGRFAHERSPLVVAVVGPDPFGEDLDDAVAGQLVRGHPVEIRRHPEASDLGDVHLVFFAGEGPALDQDLLARLRAAHVLTVGETKAFLERGGAIRVAVERRSVRVHVGLDVVEAAGLRLSSQLLRIATVHRGRLSKGGGSR